jgi:hypothetical protein
MPTMLRKGKHNEVVLGPRSERVKQVPAAMFRGRKMLSHYINIQSFESNLERIKICVSETADSSMVGLNKQWVKNCLSYYNNPP